MNWRTGTDEAVRRSVADEVWDEVCGTKCVDEGGRGLSPAPHPLLRIVHKCMVLMMLARVVSSMCG
jgi:hypothetical protein